MRLHWALLALVVVLVCAVPEAHAADIILNEYNAVDNEDFLGGPLPGPQSPSDVFWGRRAGNGQDWFELAVITDHLDMRGWRLEVVDDASDPAKESWLITLTEDDVWSDLRSGTIITISEDLRNNTDEYNPLIGRWWLNVRAAAETSGTFATVECIHPACEPRDANWKVTNNNWQLTIKDRDGSLVFGPAGEGVSPLSGVSSEEVFKLETDPSSSIAPNSPDYNDGTSSTFGQPNVFDGGTRTQDFSHLRSVVPFTQLTSVRINEVFPHSDPGEDWVELYNTTGADVDVGGWFLSDSFGDLERFEIPTGTRIPAKGYLVFYETGLGFAFNASCGDAVVLSVADGGAPTGARDFAEFGAVETGVPFGRFPNGGGSFVRLSAATRGASNAAPLIGPVVINEIMYNPPVPVPTSGVVREFVELHNVSRDAVDLFTSFGLQGTYPWKLSGGIDFGFSTHTTIPAWGFLVVVNFDPDTEPAKLAYFRETYGLDGSVAIVGPYDGKLSNFSDTVRVQKPDTPESSAGACGDPSGTPGVRVPRVIVDEVTYFDFGLWPEAADGEGSSLERMNPLGYGDDASNWEANLQGGATPGARNSRVDATTDDSLCEVETCVGEVCDKSPVPDDTPCSDRNVCNGEETCQAGQCVPGAPLICDDGDDCTRDTCDVTGGCRHQPLLDGACGPDPCAGGGTDLATLSCTLERLAEPAVCATALPKRLQRVIEKRSKTALKAAAKAEQKLARNPTAKIKRHLKKIRKALRVIMKKVDKASRAKKEKQRISTECAAALQGLAQTPLELVADLS